MMYKLAGQSGQFKDSKDQWQSLRLAYFDAVARVAQLQWTRYAGRPHTVTETALTPLDDAIRASEVGISLYSDDRDSLIKPGAENAVVALQMLRVVAGDMALAESTLPPRLLKLGLHASLQVGDLATARMLMRMMLEQRYFVKVHYMEQFLNRLGEKLVDECNRLLPSTMLEQLLLYRELEAIPPSKMTADPLTIEDGQMDWQNVCLGALRFESQRYARTVSGRKCFTTVPPTNLPYWSILQSEKAFFDERDDSSSTQAPESVVSGFDEADTGADEPDLSGTPRYSRGIICALARSDILAVLDASRSVGLALTPTAAATAASLCAVLGELGGFVKLMNSRSPNCPMEPEMRSAKMAAWRDASSVRPDQLPLYSVLRVMQEYDVAIERKSTLWKYPRLPPMPQPPTSPADPTSLTEVARPFGGTPTVPVPVPLSPASHGIRLFSSEIVRSRKPGQPVLWGHGDVDIEFKQELLRMGAPMWLREALAMSCRNAETQRFIPKLIDGLEMLKVPIPRQELTHVLHSTVRHRVSCACIPSCPTL